MAKLPCAEWAEVSMEKLRDYCLNPAHEMGRSKARAFASRLGMTARDRLVLGGRLLQAAHTEEALPAYEDQYGRRFKVDLVVDWQGSCAVVRSAWILERGATTPRLTSCFVL